MYRLTQKPVQAVILNAAGQRLKPSAPQAGLSARPSGSLRLIRPAGSRAFVRDTADEADHLE